MAGTRSSARIAGQKSSPSQPSSSPQAAGSKRKHEPSASPTAKRGRKSADEKQQKTLEETMDVDQTENTPVQEEDTSQEKQTSVDGDPNADTGVSKEENDSSNAKNDSAASETGETTQEKPVTNGKSAENWETTAAKTDKTDKTDKTPAEGTSEMDSTGKIEPKQDGENNQSNKEEQPANGDTAVKPHARDEDTPSSILEKGIIYFFFRGRTGIDNPQDVSDIARSYMILRPIPHGAKLGHGPIGDAEGKCRLLALPKKVLPLSGKDRFMTFVEKSKTSFKELKDEFMSGSDYDTKTAGVRHTPPVTPLAEGIYALTTTGRESHLAYMITIPQELNEVQKDIGLREQGSFVTSAKNPQYAGPANTNLPQSPDFPKGILDEFRSLRWAPLQPKFLDYENAQFLLIGESSGLEKATQQQLGDEDHSTETPKEEMEKLEGEDEIRIKHLKGDDTVFTDLGISKKEYPEVPSTWDS